MPQDPWDLQEEVDKRERIARILGSWELLAWHSQQNNESIVQTRYRLKKQQCGIEDEPDLYEDVMADDEQEEEELRRQRKGKAARRKAGDAGEGSASGSANGSGRKKGKA